MISIRHRRWAWLTVTMGVAVLLAGCVAKPQAGLRIGDEVPELSLTGLLGEPLVNSIHSGRAIVLNVWATWCGPCRAEMSSLQQLSEKLDPERYRVVGVSVDTDANLVSEFALRYGITFALAVDPDGNGTRSWLGPLVIPDTLIVGPDGRLADRVRGAADWGSDEMLARIKFAVAGMMPSIAQRSPAGTKPQ